MADYRRYRVAGGTYFFTLVTHSRAAIFANGEARQILGDKLRDCQAEWPFEVTAIVLLPEHLHAIWTLPPGDDAYPLRWGWIKKEFTKAWLASGGNEQPVSETRRKRGDRGVWQPRYWEHTIQDDRDFDRHFDYVHYNPWPHSSFHRWAEQGVYEPDWGCDGRGRLDFGDLEETAMEIGIA